MHLRHLRWEASPEPHPFIVPARIWAPDSITPSVSDCFLLQTSFVVFVCIDYIMSSDRSQVFLMKKFSGFYRMQTCTQTASKYAADPAPERRFRMPGGTQTHGIIFAAKAAAPCADMATLSCPGWKAEHPDRQHTQNPSHDSVAAEIACAVQELSFHKASEIYTSTACKRSGDQSDCSGVSREIKKHTQTNLSVFWQGQ